MSDLCTDVRRASQRWPEEWVDRDGVEQVRDRPPRIGIYRFTKWNTATSDCRPEVPDRYCGWLAKNDQHQLRPSVVFAGDVHCGVCDSVFSEDPHLPCVLTRPQKDAP